MRSGALEFFDFVLRRREEGRPAVIAVMGPQGSGKTALALHVLLRAYKRWPRALEFLYFAPSDFYSHFSRRPGDFPAPAIVFDDAGLWLGKSRWYEKDVRRFSELMNVARNVAWAVIFTLPSPNLPASIERNVEYEVWVVPCPPAYAAKYRGDVACGSMYRAFYSVSTKERMVERVLAMAWLKRYPDAVYRLYSLIRQSKVLWKMAQASKGAAEEEARRFSESAAQEVKRLALELGATQEEAEELASRVGPWSWG